MTEKYLIWSNEHRAWWRSNGCGYTTFLKAAGRYDRHEAIRICTHARNGWDGEMPPSEIPVREQDVLDAIKNAEEGPDVLKEALKKIAKVTMDALCKQLDHLATIERDNALRYHDNGELLAFEFSLGKETAYLQARALLIEALLMKDGVEA